MARFNEILIGRWNRGLQKLHSMKGPASVTTLNEDVQAILDLDNFSQENAYLFGWFRLGQQTLTVSAAAIFAGVRLRNPSGSNVIALVERILVSNIATAELHSLQLNAVATDLASIGVLVNSRMDPRNGVGPGSLIMSSSTAASGATSIGGTKAEFNVATGVSQDFLQPGQPLIPILPGDALQILSNTANTAWHASLWWRERFLEDSERT